MLRHTKSNLLWGVILVTISAMLLLNALGEVPEGIYDLFERGLPVVLIFAGLSLLLAKRIPMSDLVSLGICGAIVAGIAFVAYDKRSSEMRDDNHVIIAETVPSSVPLLIVNVNTLSTDVEIRAGDTPTDGITGDFFGSTENEVTVSLDYEEGADRATFTFREERGNDFPLLEAVGRGRLTLFLPPDMPIAFAFDGGDGTALFDMGNIALERFNVEVGSGDTVVTLPEYAPLAPNAAIQPGTITVGDGNMDIIVPQNIGMRFELNRGGSGIDPRYPEQNYLFLVGDVLEARDFEDAEIQLRYVLTVPSGQITIANSSNE